METSNEIIISFYKDPKTGLSINNTFRNLLRAGHKFTLRQVQEVIKDLDEYHKAKTYKEQKHLQSPDKTSGLFYSPDTLTLDITLNLG